MIDNFIAENDQVLIRTTVGSEVTGCMLQVDSISRMFIVKPNDCEGHYHIPFDAVLFMRVEENSPLPLAS